MLSDMNVSYSFFERLFRVSFFQTAVLMNGWIEQFAIFIYRLFAKCTWPEPLDSRRMDKSLDILRMLGAKEHFVTPLDGQARIQMMHIRGSDFESVLNGWGAKWVRRGNQFVILPPKKEKAAWAVFRDKYLLRKMGWTLQEDGSIVTCKNADLVSWLGTRCFLHIHYPFEFSRRRIGFYLGMKQDCAMYNPRGVRKSTGVASEKGMYLSSLAILEKVQKLGHYSMKHLWVSGSCRTAAVGAFLKKRFHKEGINFVAEQAFLNLERDMIKPQPRMARIIALRNLGALKARDIPKSVAGDIEEDHFDTEKKWKDLEQSSRGKVVIVKAKGDQTLPKGVEEKYYELAQKVNKKAYLLTFTAPRGTNPHNVSSLSDPQFARAFTRVVFS